MKILSFFSEKVDAINKTEGRVTEVKGKYHRLSHQNGLIELSFNLAPDQRATFDASASALEATLKKAISTATDTLNAKIAEAKKEAEAAVTAARATYDAALFALFTEYGRIPTREALITYDTPVNHVVRLPESAIVPPAPKAATA
jgi:NAD-specific glutamate dehydrogenase